MALVVALHRAECAEALGAGADEDEDEEWGEFNGYCAVSRADHGLTKAYLESQVTGAQSCTGICQNVPSCVAASINADTNGCLLSTDCHARHTSRKFITFIKLQGELRKTEREKAEEEEEEEADVFGDPDEDGVGGAGGAFLVENQDVEEDSCAYCPPQNPCEQPRLCRAGQCFHGLPLEDGLPCEDGDPNTVGDICLKGQCIALEARTLPAEDERATDVQDQPHYRSMKAFDLRTGVRCAGEPTGTKTGSYAELCAHECREAKGRCQAFAQELAGARTCVLFAHAARCAVHADGWLAGTLREPFTDPGQNE